MMRTLALFLALFLMSPAEASQGDDQEALQHLSNLVTSRPIVRASFIQSKTIRVLSRPLVSSGHFLFERKHGLAWILEVPFETNLVLTNRSIVEWEEGRPRVKYALSSRPAMASLGAILFPLLSGEFDGLTTSFATGVNVEGENWVLTLTPLNADLAKIIASIEVAGGEAVESININEHGGDLTRLEFSDYRFSPAMLTAEEQLYFEE